MGSLQDAAGAPEFWMRKFPFIYLRGLVYHITVSIVFTFF